MAVFMAHICYQAGIFILSTCMKLGLAEAGGCLVEALESSGTRLGPHVRFVAALTDSVAGVGTKPVVAGLSGLDNTRVLHLLPGSQAVPTNGSTVGGTSLVLSVHVRHQHLTSSACDMVVQIGPSVLLAFRC